MFRLILPSLAAFALLAAAAPALAQAPDRDRPPAAAGGYVPGEILVRFQHGVSGSERAQVRRRERARVERALEVPRVQLLELDEGASVPEAIAAFEADPRVEYAEPNYRVRARFVPDDTLFGQLWGLDDLADTDIDAPEAWDVIRGSADVKVAVVDTGVTADHPDLAANLLPGKDYVHGDDAPGDLNGHGTHVAGTIGAVGNNTRGVAGVTWDLGILPLRVLDAGGSGTFADVSDAFAYAGSQGARVVNASLGGFPSSTEIQTLEAAIAGAPNTLFVVAAGNDGVDVDAPGNAEYPCAIGLGNVLCVAASDRSDARAGFSNWGETSVDVAAPGVDIRSTTPGRTLPFQELFEVDLGAWAEGSVAAGTPVDGPTSWDRSSAPGDRTQGTWGVVDSPGGNYADNSDTYLRTASAVNVGQDCELWFDYGLDVGDAGDRFTAEAATAPGGPWTVLHSRSSDSGFSTVAVDLRDGAYDFYGQPTYFRFRLATNSATTGGGVAVDWVEVICRGGEAYGDLSGTSMSTPHVAGAAALVLGHAPGLSTAALKEILLSSGDPVAWSATPTVSGRRLNVASALAAAAALTTSAPPAPEPPPPTTADPPPSEPPPSEPPPAAPAPAPSTVEVDDEPPSLRASVSRRQRIGTLLRRGLRARLGCDEACRLRADVLVGRRTAKKLGIRGRRFGRSYVLVGRERAQLERAGSEIVTTLISRRARRGLRRARSVRLVLRVVATDEHGNARITRRSLTARR